MLSSVPRLDAHPSSLSFLKPLANGQGPSKKPSTPPSRERQSNPNRGLPIIHILK
jgi:hypothetical protein